MKPRLKLSNTSAFCMGYWPSSQHRLMTCMMLIIHYNSEHLTLWAWLDCGWFRAGPKL